MVHPVADRGLDFCDARNHLCERLRRQLRPLALFANQLSVLDSEPGSVFPNAVDRVGIIASMRTGIDGPLVQIYESACGWVERHDAKIWHSIDIEVDQRRV